MEYKSARSRGRSDILINFRNGEGTSLTNTHTRKYSYLVDMLYTSYAKFAYFIFNIDTRQVFCVSRPQKSQAKVLLLSTLADIKLPSLTFAFPAAASTFISCRSVRIHAATFGIFAIFA